MDRSCHQKGCGKGEALALLMVKGASSLIKAM
jgi:hypothetical protein